MVPIFEVVERPNDWDRQVQDIAREARAPTDLGAFRKDFWSHLIARHSSESKLGGANGASSRWRPIAGTDLVVAQYLSKRGVGVFIRGVRGADPSEWANQIFPKENELKGRLGADFNNERYMFHKFLELDGEDRSNWDRMVDWLKIETDRYEVELHGIFGGKALSG